MALQQIEEGISGQTAANIIYANDLENANGITDINGRIAPLYSETVLSYAGTRPFRYYNNVDNVTFVTASGDVSQVNGAENDTFTLNATTLQNTAYYDTGAAVVTGQKAIAEFTILSLPTDGVGAFGVGLGAIAAAGTVGVGAIMSASSAATNISRWSPRNQNNLISGVLHLTVGAVVRVELSAGSNLVKVSINGAVQYQGALGEGVPLNGATWAIVLRGRGSVSVPKITVETFNSVSAETAKQIAEETVESTFFDEGAEGGDQLSGAPYSSSSYSSAGAPVATITVNQTSSAQGLNVQLIEAVPTDSRVTVLRTAIPWNLLEVLKIKFTAGAPVSVNPAVGFGFGQEVNQFTALLYRFSGQLFSLVSTPAFETAPSYITRAAAPEYEYAAGDVIEMELNLTEGVVRTTKNGATSDPSPLLMDFNPSGNITLFLRGISSISDTVLEWAAVPNPVSQWREEVEEAIANVGGGDAVKGFFNSDVPHIIGYGQSLAVGTQSQPPISTAQLFNSLMFHGGLRIRYDYEGGTVPADYYSSFVPLIEFEAGNPQRFGETSSSGVSETIHTMLQARGLNYANNNGVRLLFSCPGRGSTAISGLTRGSEPYTQLLNEVTQGLAVAQALGASYSVPFVTWNQGETDITVGTTKAAYKQALIDLQAFLDEDIKAITGQLETVVLVTYQEASRNMRTPNNGFTGVAEAQLEAALENEYIIMSHPAYTLFYVGDNVHLTNVGSKLNGVYHGTAIMRYLETGMCKPVHPVSHTVQGRVLTLEMYAPVAPLVIDNTTVSPIANSGFRLFNASGVEVAISSVSVVRGTSIRIVAAENIGAGFELTYAANGTTTGRVNGARGNIRDSQSLTTVINDTEHRLANWLPMFRRPL